MRVPGRRWGQALGAAVAAALVVGCGAPERRARYVDQMQFARDDEVEDDAVEAVQGAPRDVDIPRGRRAEADRTAAGQAWGPPALRAPRCASPKSTASRSVGRATSGELESGCDLPARGVGYVRKNKAKWGTDRTVAILQWAFAETARLHPGTAPAVVGALSRRDGGRLKPHRSHQSGRDVDIGYFASDNQPLPHFQSMHRGNIDLDKTWTLLAALLRTGQVQYVFIDYELQALLTRYLEDQGASPAILAQLFQFPDGRGARHGVLRHASGHDDHFHVRFRCHPDDGDSCED